MTGAPAKRRRSVRLALLPALLLVYVLSIGPAWRLLAELRRLGWIGNDAAISAGFFPYLPLLFLCNVSPAFLKVLSAYLGAFGLRVTDFVPG